MMAQPNAICRCGTLSRKSGIAGTTRRPPISTARSTRTPSGQVPLQESSPSGTTTLTLERSARNG